MSATAQARLYLRDRYTLPVVDVAFTDRLPRINTALTVEYDSPDGPAKLTLEVTKPLPKPTAATPSAP